jgi:hypothetical protein
MPFFLMPLVKVLGWISLAGIGVRLIGLIGLGAEAAKKKKKKGFTLFS